jgi:MYXO-CTERM domain-containing protein
MRPGQASFASIATFASLAIAFSFAQTADAFCGFYVSDSGKQLVNNATQVALMREGTRTVLSMQNNYEGPPEKFAMIVPVPVVLQKENVKTLPRELFAKLEELDAPRLVEYWEQDPCAVPAEEKFMLQKARGAVAANAAPETRADTLGVKIEAQFSVGEYDIVVLSAENSGGLDTWLRQEKYNIPAGAEPYLRPYVSEGWRFFVAKVDPQKVHFVGSQAALSPLRFHYDSEQFKLPVRLGLINSGGKQDLIVHILARGKRYEVANYSNVTIPTNLDVEESTKGEFGTFYAGLFDETVKKNPGAVVTEYSWSASTCDPCPGPALSGSDFATLGADVLTQTQSAAPPSRYYWDNGFTLTRLHTRYDKATLGADLVFRAAPAIVGGREMYTQESKIEHGALPAPYNNFQARYAIRHPWTGAIACENPKRGIWGGPPSGQANNPTGATNLAFAKRDNAFSLASFVKNDIPEIGFTWSAPPPPAANAAPSASSSTSTAPAASGCAGCATTEDTSPAALALIAPVAIALMRRRRRP